MDITVPFLIFIIIVSCILLYKVAGINPMHWRIKKTSQKKEVKKEEPKPEVTTKKSFIKRKQVAKKTAEETEKPELTNKPSEGAVVTPVFESVVIDQKLKDEITNADKISDKSNDYLADVKPIEKPNMPGVRNIGGDSTMNVPAFGDVKTYNTSTFLKNPNVKPNMTSKEVERALFGGKQREPKMPPMSSIFDTRRGIENKNPFSKPMFPTSPLDNKFVDFNDDDEFDDFFSPNIGANKPKVNEEEYFEKKVVGEKIATTVSKKKDKYWI